MKNWIKKNADTAIIVSTIVWAMMCIHKDDTDRLKSIEKHMSVIDSICGLKP